MQNTPPLLAFRRARVPTLRRAFFVEASLTGHGEQEREKNLHHSDATGGLLRMPYRFGDLTRSLLGFECEKQVFVHARDAYLQPLSRRSEVDIHAVWFVVRSASMAQLRCLRGQLEEPFEPRTNEGDRAMMAPLWRVKYQTSAVPLKDDGWKQLGY